MTATDSRDSTRMTAAEYARVIAAVHEPDLDWDNECDYDLLDRDVLMESAQKQMKALEAAGYKVLRIDSSNSDGR